MRRGVSRVLFNCLLKQLDSLSQSWLGAFVPEDQALQVELVGLRSNDPALHRGALSLKMLGDLTRDIFLNCDDVLERAVVSLGPEFETVSSANELGGHMHLRPRLGKAPREQRRHAQN